MSRPKFISNEDLDRWSDIIDNDLTLPKHVAKEALIREVCYAGLWLAE